MRVAKRTKTNQTNPNPERWIPYFNSKRLRTSSDEDDGEAAQSTAADDEQAGDSESLENAAMQECQSLRRAFIEINGPNGHPPNLKKLRAEFDTGADDCMMTKSCYLQLRELLTFKNGKVDIVGATAGETTMTQYVELDLNIGSIHFPPGIKFWLNEKLTQDAGFDVILSGPFLAHHNVIYIDPKLQREVEKAGNVDVKMQKHFDFPEYGVTRRQTPRENLRKTHWH